MIVSFVLDTEYMGEAERKKWFLKMLAEAQKTDMLIITHEYMKNHLMEIVEECEDRFYRQFDMKKLTEDEITKIDICYIPDRLLTDIYNKCHTRSKMLLELMDKDNSEIEEIVINSIEENLKKRGQDKPECILNCLHVLKFVKNVAKKFDCAIVPYVFSAIRKVHGYEQTLYMAHVDEKLFNSDAAEKIYESWDVEKLEFPIFSRKEILALLGKQQNMFLFPIMNSNPLYELGIIGEGFHITPEIYAEYQATDDDIFYEAKKFYLTEEINERIHPIQLDQMGIGRKHMKNDPASFVLSCKRIATVQSQMILKAALWGRPTIRKSNALPYTFMMSDRLDTEKTVSEEDLNFIVFSYLVPEKLMFDSEYWTWRLNRPTANEMAVKHIRAIFEDIKLDENILYSENRLKELLKCRQFSEKEISEILCQDKIETDFKYPLSKLVSSNKNTSRIYFSLNRCIEQHEYSCRFEVEETAEAVDICLQNDVDGFVLVKKVVVNGTNMTDTFDMNEKYFEKGQTTLNIGNLEKIKPPFTIMIEWQGIYFNDKR